MKPVVIAIDGPAGAGKTTVSKIVAKKLGFLHVDTGAMYRAITYKLLKSGISLDDIESIEKIIETTNISFKQKDNEIIIFIDNIDLSKKIRSEYVTANVNIVASIPIVREKLRQIQRYLGEHYNCVIEGRDITTAVFPDTKYKFYLDAPVEERALRRYKEMIQKGEQADLQQIKEAIIRRDNLDKTRGINPLKIGSDVIVINTLGLTPQQVAEKIISYISL